MATKQRSKTTKGTTTAKGTDTHIVTIEKKYGKDYGVSSNMEIGDYLNENGYRALSVLLKNGKK